MRLVALFLAVAVISPTRSWAQAPTQQLFIDRTFDPPVVRIDLIPRRSPPTTKFLMEQGLVSIGLQTLFAGATAGIIAIVANHVKSTDVTAATAELIGASIPTTLGYVLVPSIVLTHMADRPMASVYFQQVFWASGVMSSFWTLAILATDTQQGGSIPLAVGFAVAGVLLTAALQVWMGYMDWDADPPSQVIPAPAQPPTQPAARFNAPAPPTPAGISLISWRF